MNIPSCIWNHIASFCDVPEILTLRAAVGRRVLLPSIVVRDGYPTNVSRKAAVYENKTNMRSFNNLRTLMLVYPQVIELPKELENLKIVADIATIRLEGLCLKRLAVASAVVLIIKNCHINRLSLKCCCMVKIKQTKVGKMVYKKIHDLIVDGKKITDK